MKLSVLLLVAGLLSDHSSFSQSAYQRRRESLANMRQGGQVPDKYGGTTMQSNWDGNMTPISNRTDGYLVYKRDTLRGLVTLSANSVLLERPIDADRSIYYVFHFNNTDLRTIMMYNTDKKPLCVTRVSEKDKRMLRLVHEGKLNIYDDRIAYIYEPKDIDKNYIIISSADGVEDLSSFLTENTKRDLIIFVNDIYGLNIDPKSISWLDLLARVDMLD